MSALSGECCLKGGGRRSITLLCTSRSNGLGQERTSVSLTGTDSYGSSLFYLSTLQCCIDELLRLIDLKAFN